MKLKYQFVTNEVAEHIVAVAVGEDMSKFNGFIKMNSTGAEIFNLLREEITEDELIAKMSEIYPDDEIKEIESAVKEFVGQLVEAGVVE